MIDWSNHPTPIDRWILSFIGMVVALALVGACLFWLLEPPESWYAIGLAGLAAAVAYEYGKVVGRSVEQIDQDTRDRQEGWR